VGGDPGNKSGQLTGEKKSNPDETDCGKEHVQGSPAPQGHRYVRKRARVLEGTKTVLLMGLGKRGPGEKPGKRHLPREREKWTGETSNHRTYIRGCWKMGKNPPDRTKGGGSGREKNEAH